MGRSAINIETLHNFKIEELIEIRNSTENNRQRLILTTVIMRYLNYSNKEIMTLTGLCQATIVSYVKKWNAVGFDTLKECRGGSLGKLSPDIIENLIYTVKNVSPIDKGFVANTWTCALLALYIEREFGVKVTEEAIRLRLIENNISYKRAQPMPTKFDKAQQEAFKKNTKPTIYFRIFI
ncbi:winged helix-turn-helix domain-containing protein [Clostridium sp. ATCC 25772]|nr:winged helix-turn-helix domain-containing protein [Clostridium sp. ATCC 25772]